MSIQEDSPGTARTWSIARRPTLSVTTPILFGRYVANRRRTMSQEQLSAHLDVPTSWVAALERGELVPTNAHLVALERELPASEDNKSGLLAVLLELDLQPWGMRALKLRAQAGLPAPDPSALAGSEASNLIPALTEIPYQTRQLVATPLAAMLLGMFWLWLLHAGPGSAPRFTLPTGDQVTAATAVVGLVALVCSSFANNVIWWAARRCRDGHVQRSRANVREVRSVHGLVSDPGCDWSMQGELAHLTAKGRRLVRDLGTSLDRTERLVAVVVGLFAIASVSGAIEAAIHPQLGALWWLGTAVGLYRVLGVLRHKVAVESDNFFVALGVGLGAADDKGTTIPKGLAP